MKAQLRRIATAGCLVLASAAAAPAAQAQGTDGDRPHVTPVVVGEFSKLAEDPEAVDHLFDTLDKLSTQDMSSGEIVQDTLVDSKGEKKRLVGYIVKVSKEVHKQTPKGAKVLIDRLLDAHRKHDLISDPLAAELAAVSASIR